MNNNSQSQFTPEEHSLFHKIAADIKDNSESYRQAGKWLDKFYNKTKEQSIKIRFDKAHNCLAEQYKDLNFISEEDAKKTILITWLLTDPDAENYRLNVTGFEKWGWGTSNGIFLESGQINRGFAGFSFSQNKDSWMNLVNIAWDKITVSRQKKVHEHVNNQEGISKGDFLDDLISEIDGLLEQEGALNKFQSQFNNFCDMVEEYGTELDKYRQAAERKFNDFANKNPESQKLLKGFDKLLLNEQIKIFSNISHLYIAHCSTPPIDNPTWVTHNGWLSDYVVEYGGFSSIPLIYRPPLLELPQNPVFWFFSEMERYLSSVDPIKLPDEKELLMCDFVRIAVIHDESCSYNKSIMVYKSKNYDGKFKRDDFTKDLWEAYKNPKDNNFIRTHKRILQQALNHVKSDLRQSQTKIDFENNFIKATIKHLPYVGAYLFDLIYGVDGVKTQKKELAGQKIDNAHKPIEQVSPYIKAGNGKTDTKTVEKKPLYKKAWPYIIGGLSFLVLLTTLWLNIDKIKEQFSPKKAQTTFPAEKQLSGNYTIESLSLKAAKAENLLNDDKDQKSDEIRLQLSTDEEANSLTHTIDANGNYSYDFKFKKDFKEIPISVCLFIKDKKDNDKEKPIGGTETIDLKGKPIEFETHIRGTNKVKYSLTYKISQKGGS